MDVYVRKHLFGCVQILEKCVYKNIWISWCIYIYIYIYTNTWICVYIIIIIIM